MSEYYDVGVEFVGGNERVFIREENSVIEFSETRTIRKKLLSAKQISELFPDAVFSIIENQEKIGGNVFVEYSISESNSDMVLESRKLPYGFITIADSIEGAFEKFKKAQEWVSKTKELTNDN